MAYIKTNWAAAKISNANLNKMQEQYDEAIVDMWNARTDTTRGIRAYKVNSFPEHRAGLLIYHTGMKRFFMSNGSAWLVPPADAPFGSGAGGEFSSTGNILLSNAVGATVIADYASFKLNEDHVLTTENAFRVLVIRSWGDIVIDGEINIDKRGGFPERYITIGGQQYDLQGGDGGNGGDGGHGHISYAWGGAGGSANANEDCAGGRRGGGGGGGAINAETQTGIWGSNGGDGGPKNTGVNPSMDPQWGGEGGDPLGGKSQGGGVGSRGSGGGGAACEVPLYNYDAYGGRGGGSRDGGSGGGGGAVIVFSSASTDGGYGSPSPGEYGGGALVLLAGGDIVINGQILARGGKGGDGGEGKITGSGLAAGAGGGGGGGGSGGGRVIILHRGDYTLNGNVVVTGGSGGTGGASTGGTSRPSDSGYSGRVGSVQVKQL